MRLLRGKPIFLLGYMCSGKTTLGVALARALACKFIDLDDQIEAEAGMAVRDIFATRGEAAFRQLERHALQQACSSGSAIVACGGGTPCQPGAMDMMRDAGLTVWLRPSPDRLVGRLMDGRHKRPLIAHIADPAEMGRLADKMMHARATWYSQAHLQFDSSLLESESEIELSVNKFITDVCQYLKDR